MNIVENSISVVVPVYNAEKTIERVVDGILQQTYYKYIREIILINDGSNDTTMQVLNKLKEIYPDIIKIINVQNGGVSRARNLGLESSTGTWIALCDADDIWLQDKIETQVKIINSNDNVDFLGGNHRGKVQRFILNPILSVRRFSVRDLCIKMLPQTSTALFKREIYEKIGGYDVNQGFAEDGNFFLRIAANYGYYYTPVQMVNYGDGKSGFGESGLSANIVEMHKGILKNYKEMYQNHYISFCFWCFAVIFENIKFARRVLIVKLRH